MQPQFWDVLLAEGALDLGTLQQLLGILTYENSTTASIMLLWEVIPHCNLLPTFLHHDAGLMSTASSTCGCTCLPAIV